jgi:hypothetical protein
MKVTRDEILLLARRLEEAIDDPNEGEEVDAELLNAAEAASTLLSKLAGEKANDGPSLQDKVAIQDQLIDELLGMSSELFTAIEKDARTLDPETAALAAEAKHKIQNIRDTRSSC